MTDRTDPLPLSTQKEDVRPKTPLLLTVTFLGMGLVFVALGFPTTLLAVLGGHVYGLGAKGLGVRLVAPERERERESVCVCVSVA